MDAAADDWRRRGQEDYLKGARLTWRRYQALRPDWEHEHCAFCWHKFLDAKYSEVHRRLLEERPDAQSPAGYTTIEPPGEYWICEACFGDFGEEFGFTVVDADPEGWPYVVPEPDPRPTVEQYRLQD